MARTTLVWFRNDLRCSDNPALQAAMAHGAEVTALFIHETDEALRPITGAARWWLHESLGLLAQSLAARGIKLVVKSGAAEKTVTDTATEINAEAVFWNRRYGAPERALDAQIKSRLKAQKIGCESFNGSLLVEPWDIETGQGKPYSVFTPFWNNLRQRDLLPPTAAAPEKQSKRAANPDADYELAPWTRKIAANWQVGEAHAQEVLRRFLDERIAGYKDGRDFPARLATSELSPYLRFGEISPRQIWYAALHLAHDDAVPQQMIEKFLSELAWREFSYHLLYHRPDIATVPMQAKYADMPWRHDPKALKAWQAGMTGFPIIDAGMRQLWQTGWMHNRVRMLVASLLAKNLLIDWRLGEQWFWDTLVDADPANNPASWQWVAGCGADAAPYFRIFNPVMQGERFDADGDYVRRWVPELSALPDKWVHQPFAAPSNILKDAKVILGKTYPLPIADLKQSRTRALAALNESET